MIDFFKKYITVKNIIFFIISILVIIFITKIKDIAILFNYLLLLISKLICAKHYTLILNLLTYLLAVIIKDIFMISFEKRSIYD